MFLKDLFVDRANAPMRQTTSRKGVPFFGNRNVDSFSTNINLQVDPCVFSCPDDGLVTLT